MRKVKTVPLGPNEVILVLREGGEIETVFANDEKPRTDTPQAVLAERLTWWANEVHKVLEPMAEPSEESLQGDVELSEHPVGCLCDRCVDELGMDAAIAASEEATAGRPSEEEVDQFVEQAQAAEDALQAEIASTEVPVAVVDAPEASEGDSLFMGVKDCHADVAHGGIGDPEAEDRALEDEEGPDAA